MSRERPPPVRLGVLAQDGIAPSVFVLIERGADRRPQLAKQARGVVELRFREAIAPARIRFGGGEIVVEDVTADTESAHPEPDLIVSGSLPDVVRLTVTPTLAGLPSPVDGRGRSVLGQLMRGRLRIEGDRGLGRRLLALLALE